MTGLASGTVWGLYDGLRHPEGRTTRLRTNSLLNGLTRRGPFLANTLAVLGTLMGGEEEEEWGGRFGTVFFFQFKPQTKAKYVHT